MFVLLKFPLFSFIHEMFENIFFKGAHSEFSMLKFLCDFIHTVHTAIGTVNFLIGIFIVFSVSKKWDSIVSEYLKVIIVTFLALNILGYKQVLNIV